MAKLKNGCQFTKDKFDISLFEAELDSYLLEVFLVENRSLLLVTEIVPQGLAYNFFDINSNTPIDLELRYLQENNKENISYFGDNYKATHKVLVDRVTGFEQVNEKVTKDNKTVYEVTRERYSLLGVDSITERFYSFTSQGKENEVIADNFVDDFFNSDYSKKINILRSYFRKEWRNRCELGLENPECFLPNELYKRLSQNADFSSSLLEMLKKEEYTVDIKAEYLYEKINSYYNSK